MARIHRPPMAPLPPPPRPGSGFTGSHAAWSTWLTERQRQLDEEAARRSRRIMWAIFTGMAIVALALDYWLK